MIQFVGHLGNVDTYICIPPFYPVSLLYNWNVMSTLTVNIDDQSAEREVTALLDKLGLNYSINTSHITPSWWEDEALVKELDNRSEALKSGKDNGVSFAEVKQRLLSK